MASQLSTATADALIALGQKGTKAVEMIEAAAWQLTNGRLLVGEMTTFACREALKSLLQLSQVGPGPSIKAASRNVVRARAITTDASDGTALASAIQELDDVISAAENANAAQLEAVIRERAGIRPVRFQADLFEEASTVLIKLNRGLHGSVATGDATVLYERSVGLIERLFAPISQRLDTVRTLSDKSDPQDSDVRELEQLAADPRVLQFFFLNAGPEWFDRLGDHPLLQPTETGLWLAFGFVSATAKRENGPRDIGRWLTRRAVDPACHVVAAAAYIQMAREVGPQAIQCVKRVVERFGSSQSILEEASLFLSGLPDDQLIDGRVLEIADRILSGTNDDDV